MAQQLMVGMVFKGFCNGFFGRDSYGEKRVEAFGYDWIVAREDGKPVFCHFSDGWIGDRDKLITDWLADKGYGE